MAVELNGLIKTRGSLYGGTWQMEVPELKLTGNVKQNKVNVDGTLKGNSYMQWMILASSGTRAKQCRSERRAGGKRSQS